MKMKLKKKKKSRMRKTKMRMKMRIMSLDYPLKNIKLKILKNLEKNVWILLMKSKKFKLLSKT
jgi:hypothetical protein